MSMDWLENLMERAAADPWYQECLADLNAREPAFLAIRSALPEAQRDALDAYIAACEELDFSILQVACAPGRESDAARS